MVLSACQTALGEERAGEGMLSLQRAFHDSGARAVVASLWKVDDQATSDLMQEFYTRLWVDGMDQAEALRAAQLSMLARNRVELGGAWPSLWGAFVLSGG